MSSKLVKGHGSEVSEMDWRKVGASPPPSGTTVFPPPANHSAQSGPLEDQRRRVEQLEERIRNLEREVEQRAQAALQQGMHQGEARAREQMSAQIDAAIQRLARSVEELSGTRQRHRHEAEADVVKLSLAIARRILHRELTIDPGALFGLVKAALDKLDAQEIHRVRVHPEHAGPLQLHLERIGLPRRIEVLADPSLERGAVVLESSRGTLDASTETQLQEIERGFTDMVRRA